MLAGIRGSSHLLAKLFALFIIVPLLELTLLLMFSHVTGHWIYSVLLVLTTGTIGVWLARRQGLSILGSIRRQLGEGSVPTDALIDGAMILFAGGLLMTPGILTDLFGVSLLIPQIRRIYRRHVINWLKRKFPIANMRVQFPGQDDKTVDSYVIKPDPEKDFDAESN